MITGREIFLDYLQQHYNPPPARSQAPEIGQTIADATWPRIASNSELLRSLWSELCRQWAYRYLKDPPGTEDDLQEAFVFYSTPEIEQKIINSIGHRRMQTPDDDQAMVDLVNPEATSSDELFRLAVRLESYGKLCIARAAYIRQLARSRKKRGF